MFPKFYRENLTQEFIDEVLFRQPPVPIYFVLLWIKKYFRSGRTQAVHEFDPDSEINAVADDDLERYGFAETLAKSIATWDGSDSSVAVALYGAWGSGKSSIKNLTLLALQELDTQPKDWLKYAYYVLLRNRGLHKYRIVEFNPWEWSRQNNLAEAFFETALIALKKPADHRASEKASRYLKYYAARAGVFSLPPSTWKNILLYALIFGVGWQGASVSTILGRTAELVPATFSPFIKAVAPVFTALIGIGATFFVVERFLSSWARTTQRRAELLKKTLDEVKQDLAQELRKTKSPIIFIIDDIDRLDKDETRALFKLIKANSDLPNFLYFLMFDRSVVEKSLHDGGFEDGCSYLEKIVQVGIDIPSIRKEHLKDAFVRAIFKIAPKGDSVDELRKALEVTFERWLVPYLLDLRDIKLLVTSLRFHLKIFKRDDSLEVNLDDWILVEAVRIFEPQVYERIRRERELLTKYSMILRPESRYGEEERKKLNVRIDAIKNVARNTESLAAILEHLFPLIKLYKNPNHGRSGISLANFVNRRICSNDLFDFYFDHYLPKDVMNSARLERLVQAITDGKESVGRVLSELNSEVDLVSSLSTLGALRNLNRNENREVLVSGIFDFVDRLAYPSSRTGELSRAAAYFLYEFMAEFQSQVPLSFVIDCMRASLNPEIVILLAGRYLKRFREVRGISYITEEESNLLTDIARTALHTVSADINLVTYDGGPRLLTEWATIEGHEAVLNYVRGKLNNIDDYVALLKNWSGRTADGEYHIFMDDLVNSGFIPIDEIHRFVTENSPPELGDVGLLTGFDAAYSQWIRRNASAVTDEVEE